MKATERHHLKENEFAEWLNATREWFDHNRNLILYGGTAIVLVAAAVAGTLAYRSMEAGKATGMLAEAMSVAEAAVVPPAVSRRARRRRSSPGRSPRIAPGWKPPCRN